MSGQFGDVFQGFGGGTLMGLITLSIVFLALSGIALIIYGVKYLVAILEKAGHKTKRQEGAEPAPVAEKKITAVAPAAVESPVSPGGAGEEEILAVITAALAVMTEAPARITAIRPAERPKTAFVPAWKTAGRLEGFEGFQGLGE